MHMHNKQVKNTGASSSSASLISARTMMIRLAMNYYREREQRVCICPVFYLLEPTNDVKRLIPELIRKWVVTGGIGNENVAFE